MFGMLSVFSEFERSMIRERVIAGQQRAKAQGKHIGRKTNVNDGIMKYSQDIRGSIWEGNFLVSDFKICKSLKEDQ